MPVFPPAAFSRHTDYPGPGRDAHTRDEKDLPAQIGDVVRRPRGPRREILVNSRTESTRHDRVMGGEK
jgi:hypothetical protein